MKTVKMQKFSRVNNSITKQTKIPNTVCTTWLGHDPTNSSSLFGMQLFQLGGDHFSSAGGPLNAHVGGVVVWSNH
jgi:hypothetical protein